MFSLLKYVFIIYSVVVVLFDLYSLRFFFRIQAHMYVCIFLVFFNLFWCFCYILKFFRFFFGFYLKCFLCCFCWFFIIRILVTVLFISCIAWMTKRPGAGRSENVLGCDGVWHFCRLIHQPQLPHPPVRIYPSGYISGIYLYSICRCIIVIQY